MNELTKFIESGILEMYVLGQTSAAENAEVEKMVAIHEAVRDEIESISITLEQYAQAHAIEPDPMIQVFLMATIDYMERLKKGEQASFPPAIHAGSKISDYADWLNRADLLPAEPLEAAHATIIGHTHEMTTAIVWLKYGAPPETHTVEQERFLVIDGTCDIIIGNNVYHMKPGNVMSIPLHQSHSVKVTSPEPCRVILQRAAA